MLNQKKRTIILIINFILFGAIYWGLGNTRYTIFVTYFYYALCLILSVFYLLVAGGLRKPPLPEGKEKPQKKIRKKDYHPVKKREKYKTFRFQGEKKEEETEEGLGPNFLKIPEEKRPLICHLLILFVLPLYGIFLLDWFYLKFFI